MHNKYKLNDSICLSTNNDSDTGQKVIYLTFLSADDDVVYKIDGVATELFDGIITDQKEFQIAIESLISKYGEKNRDEIKTKGTQLFDDLLCKDIVISLP
jgi:hypothetical protein